MKNNQLVDLSIAELAPMIKKRKVSPVEVTQSILNKIKVINPKINAYITVLEKEAMEHARQAEREIIRGDYRGKLHGIPLAIKDNIDMEGIRTTYGSKIHEKNIPDQNATVITRLLKAGMIPIGKTNLHEYACGVTTSNPYYNQTRNPWNLDKIPGGSSGGSAAALASNITIASLGTDTTGSIRIPSACCGTVGLKPTYGRVSKKGVFPLSWTLDHVGPMTKTVEDAALMLKAMEEYDQNNLFPQGKVFSDINVKNSNLNGYVIGISEEIYNEVDPSIKQGMMKTVKELKTLGAEIRNVTIPSLDQIQYATEVILCVEAATVHHQNLVNHQDDDFGSDVRIMLKFGEILTGVQYMQAQQLRKLISKELKKTFKSIDALLIPTIPVPAPDINQTYVQINGEKLDLTNTLVRFSSIASISGLPALAISSGFSPEGLPVGIELIGKPFDEQTIINIGRKLEKVL